MIIRKLEKEIVENIDFFDVNAILGARQVGKTTLAKHILKNYQDVLYLDLERTSHLNILRNDPEKYLLMQSGKLICIDEIQLMPGLFPLIRSLVDEETYHSKFLILGSASPELLRQSSETLAGRIIYHILTPFLWTEINNRFDLQTYHLRGGFPKSLLASRDKSSFIWLENFIQTFLERDLQQFGYNIPSQTLSRLWKMIAHSNGQILNSSQLGKSLGVSHTTVRKYIDILQYTFMVRLLPSYQINIKKRLVKSPKIHIRDTGILHALLHIHTYEQLFTHPVYGSSFETMVIENIINQFSGFEPFYYRNANGNEIDLVLVKGNKKIAVEVKASTAPKITKGFHIAIDDIKADKAFVVADVEHSYPAKNDIMIMNLNDFLQLDLENL